MSAEAISKILAKYIPSSCVAICTEWITAKNIHLRITRGRASKYGDYRPDQGGNGHHISINHDLNPYSFLITFTHEVAHLHCYIRYKYRHDPHGKEWKQEFSSMLNKFLVMKVFPPDIEKALRNYMLNPSATSCTDHDLHRALKRYDLSFQMEVYHLEDLEHGSSFTIHQSKSGLVFRKGDKRRTRFHCIELHSHREYLVSALAEVVKIN